MPVTLSMPHRTAAAQRVDEGDAHWRSNLESFLTAGAGRKGPGGVHSMDDLAGANAEIDDEFGTDSSTESVTLEAKATGSEEVEDELDVLLETTKGSSAAVEDVGESERAGEWEEAMGYYAFGKCAYDNLGRGGVTLDWHALAGFALTPGPRDFQAMLLIHLDIGSQKYILSSIFSGKYGERSI